MTAVVDELAALLAAHREIPRRQLPPLLVSGCKCGWGHEVAAHSFHAAEVIAEHFAAVTAERDAAVAKVAAVEALAESLVWVRPDKSPCEDIANCCGHESSCDEMQPVIGVVGAKTIRAALDTQPAATEGANHD